MRVAKSSEIFTTSAAACRERSVGYIDYSNGKLTAPALARHLSFSPFPKRAEISPVKPSTTAWKTWLCTVRCVRRGDPSGLRIHLEECRDDGRLWARLITPLQELPVRKLVLPLGALWALLRPPACLQPISITKAYARDTVYPCLDAAREILRLLKNLLRNRFSRRSSDCVDPEAQFRDACVYMSECMLFAPACRR